jgi:hypothetical protein
MSQHHTLADWLIRRAARGTPAASPHFRATASPGSRRVADSSNNHAADGLEGSEAGSQHPI